MERYFRSALIAIVLLLLQTTFVPYISLAGYLPDLFLPWLVILALRRGQMEVTVTGFAVGLLQDAAATKFFGLAALSKTVACFVAGYFFNENTTTQTLGSYRYVFIVMLCSLIHDILYFTIFLQGSEGPMLATMIQLAVGTTLYTGVVSILPMFAFSQKYSTSWAQ